MESTFLLNYASMGMFIHRLHSNILMIYTHFGHYFLLFSSWIGFVHLFISCGCQTVQPFGHWHSGTQRAAPPSTWSGCQRDWCHCRTPSSSQNLLGRSHPPQHWWCCLNGGRQPVRRVRFSLFSVNKVESVEFCTQTQAHLQILHIRQTTGHTGQTVVVKVQLPQVGEVR